MPSLHCHCRSYGRPARTVQVEANFVPFNPDIIPTSEDWGLLGRPFFHTYWTDCVSRETPYLFGPMELLVLFAFTL